MKEIIVSILVLSVVTTIARMILPRFERFVKFIINRLVTVAEKKVQGSGMGVIRKAKVMRWLGWFGIHASKLTTEFIDTAVDVMNSKGCDIKENITSDVGDNVVHNIEKNVKKVVK